MERHPERRMRSAFSEFEKEELPLLKEQHPELRHSQLETTASEEVEKIGKKSIQSAIYPAQHYAPRSRSFAEAKNF